MIVAPAGLRFDVDAEGGLTDPERQILARLEAVSSASSHDSPAWPITITAPSKAAEAAMRVAADLAPATIGSAQGRVQVTHRRYMGEVDLSDRRAVLYSPQRDGLGLEVMVRVALQTRLPGAGGIPLHAAGLVVGGSGVAFFGRSGAGKSTLAGACPWPVLSDELVAVAGTAPRLHATGFWGALGAAESRVASAPLRALVALDKGPTLRLTPLSPHEALRALLSAVLVPPFPALWSEALTVIGALTRSVPAYRMQWNPAEPPWTELSRRLAA